MKKKGKVVILLDKLTTGGLEKISIDLANGLADFYDIYLICSNQPSFRDDYLPVSANISVKYFSNDRDTKEYLIGELKPDILLIQPYYKNTNSFWLDIPNCKKILSIHGNIIRLIKSNILNISGNSYWHNFDAITSVNRSSTFVLKESLDNVVYLPNFIEIKELQKKETRGKNIIMVANISFLENKNPIKLLRIFAQTLKLEPKATLTIVGKYDLLTIDPLFKTNVKSELSRLNLLDKVNLVGSTLDVAKYYDEADLFLFTSRGEGFGLVLLEASLHNLPLVALSYTCIEDIITNAKTGYLFEQNDDEKIIAEKILEILNNKELSNNLTKNSISHIKEKFEKNIIIQKWVELIDNTLNLDKTEMRKFVKNWNKSEHLEDNIDYKILAKDLSANILYSQAPYSAELTDALKLLINLYKQKGLVKFLAEFYSLIKKHLIQKRNNTIIQ